MRGGWLTRLLVLSLVCSAFGRAGAAEAGSPAAAPGLRVGDLTLTPWQPAESYQGGAQFDARLDQPVQFWRGAIPLRDVFTDVTRQTGVALALAAPQRIESRLCVTLFLNPKQPPSLREVLAQLSWATGCTFGYEEKAGAKSYYLLWSSAGEGTAAEVAAQEADRMQQFRTEWEVQVEAQRRSALTMLAEAKSALALSRDEAIARYRGNNDALLLNLLDPGRRAALGFLLALPEADTKELLEGPRGTLSRQWSDWSPEQQAALTQALGLQGKLPAQGPISVTIEARFGGALRVSTGAGQERVVLGRMRGLFATGNVWGDEEIALRQSLGEIQTPEQESAARDQQRQDRQARGEEFRQQWTERRTQAMVAARALSPAREAQLASLSLPDTTSESALWQLQEAVAKATGLHVVSDCVWPPRFSFFPRPGRETIAAPRSALDALSAACLDSFAGFGGPFGGQTGDLGVQWGDAGTFLRFRAQRADMWRAAVLPVAVQTQLDAWLQPYVDRATAEQGPGATPLGDDLEKLSWLAGRLDDLQVRLGGVVPYEDPSDPQAARLQALRAATLGSLAMRLPVLRWMATFTPEQWTKVRADGLEWGHDLTPDQQSTAISDMMGRDVPEGRLQDAVLQLGPFEQQANAPRGGGRRRGARASGEALKVTLDGELVAQIPLMAWRMPGGGPGGPPGGGGGGGGARGGRRGRGGWGAAALWACYARTGQRWALVLRPFRAYVFLALLPRALPWAFIFRPFGAYRRHLLECGDLPEGHALG